ncbi:MAG: hypothetical protein JWP08_1410 [Bryobacterales bacterium]|nr:hypothetical protein [Bryobacterales bacterium]
MPRRAPEQSRPNLPLKRFVGAMSLGLIITSVLGVYMALIFGRDERLIWGLLGAGTVLPPLLTFA